MERVSLVQFRRNARAVIRKVAAGRGVLLTVRNRPVVRLEPIVADQVSQDDPFYQLGRLASANVNALTNEEIDKIIYGT
jgi:antitoxin (DNA-binding transcriptional repressor) of toxin-antitoxin stability system